MNEIILNKQKISGTRKRYARIVSVNVKYSEEQNLYTAALLLENGARGKYHAIGLRLYASDRDTIIKMIEDTAWLYPVKRNIRVMLPDGAETDWCAGEII